MQPQEQGQDATNVHRLHQELIDKVKAGGYITSQRVEEAFRAVPRHLFLPHLPPQEVYQDRPIMTKMIDGDYVSSSSQPTMMAIMLEQLDLQPGQRVLEIGAGTGYNAALMAYIVGKTGQVVTIDIDEDIVEGARAHLAAAGFERVQAICADGGLGYAEAAPYDRIILTVGASDITPAWHEQLRPDGRFLLPLAVRGPQVSVAFEPRPDTPYWESVSVRPCGFVGLRGAFAGEGKIVELSPEPERILLQLGTQQEVDSNAMLALLNGTFHDIPAHISVQPTTFSWGLNFWLAVHDARFCQLITTGDATKRSFLPGATNSDASIPIDFKMRRLSGLFAPDALALMYLAPETPKSLVASVAQKVASAGQTQLPLSIRSYGTDDSLAQQLVAHMQAWHNASQPNEQRLRIRVAPRATRNTFTFTEEDILVERKWSRFVFHWT